MWPLDEGTVRRTVINRIEIETVSLIIELKLVSDAQTSKRCMALNQLHV
jgi:hypothetical protein